MGMPLLLQAAMTSLSFLDPPGWIMAQTPAAAAASSPGGQAHAAPSSAAVCGADSIALTKLDVLTGLDDVRLGDRDASLLLDFFLDRVAGFYLQAACVDRDEAAAAVRLERTRSRTPRPDTQPLEVSRQMKRKA